MPRSVRLRWTPVNTAHIFRHGGRTNEVEELTAGPYPVEPGYGGRSVFIALSRSGRFLTVMVEAEGNGQYFPVTARPASRKERRRFRQTFGGSLP